MIVRKAGIRDLDALKEIKTEFFLWECGRDRRMRPEYAKNGLGSRLAKNLRQSNVAFFVAEDDGVLVGYAGVEIQKNPASFRHKKRGHLFNLYVREGYRNKGVGKKLARAALDWLDKKRIKDRMIMVYAHNKRAHRMYKSMGFDDYIVQLTNQ